MGAIVIIHNHLNIYHHIHLHGVLLTKQLVLHVILKWKSSPYCMPNMASIACVCVCLFNLVLIAYRLLSHLITKIARGQFFYCDVEY